MSDNNKDFFNWHCYSTDMENLKKTNLSKREQFLKTHQTLLDRRLEKMLLDQQNGQYPTELSFPIGLQFEVTSQCNLSCIHCYNRSDSHFLPKMNIDAWQSVVNDIISNGGIFQCIISGGEPLMIGYDLVNKIMKPLADDGTGFVLITNGFLVNEKWVSELKNFNYYWIQVSIDHLIPEKHDEFRGHKDSWNKAVNAALMFSAAGFPLRISHSLTPDSLSYFPDFVEFAYSLGASSIVCGEIMLSGRVQQHREVLMKQNDYEQLYAMLEELRCQYAGKIDILGTAPEVLEMRHHQKTVNSVAIIRPDGDVRLDCTMPFTIGNVLEKSFSQIWKEKGNTCWKHPKVEQYISDLEKNGHNVEHINHFHPDMVL